MKTLWMVSGGFEAIPGIIEAKKLGLNVVVSDGNPSAPGFAYADHSVVADTYNIEQTLDCVKDYCRKGKVDGVISVASDVPLTVATIANEFGLPGISIETALLASNKLKMKQRFLERGISTPWFSAISNSEELTDFVRAKRSLLVLKPVDSRGARGVLLLDEDANLEEAFKFSKGYSPSGSLVLEEFISGPQVSTESILTKDNSWTPGFVDRNYSRLNDFLPSLIEDGGEQPSSLSHQDRLKLANLAVDAGRSLGVIDGVVKGDMVLSPVGPMVIEVATRLSGGWLSTDQIPLGTGVNFVQAAIYLALGIALDEEKLLSNVRNGVAIRYFFPEAGVIKSIQGLEHYSKKPWVHKLEVLVPVGGKIFSVKNHTQRAGFVITIGNDRSEAVSRAEEVVNNIKFVMED
jgi:biotin carboxylase